MTIQTAARPAGFATSPAQGADLVRTVARAASRALALAAVVAIQVAIVLALTGVQSGPATSPAPIPEPRRWAAPVPVTLDVEPAAPLPGAAPIELR